MTSVASRPRQRISLLIAFLGLAVLLHTSATRGLRDTSFVTGWLLLALVVGLALFNSRKKLPFLPLASASSWLQFHAYAGWASLAIFVLHAGAGIPTGGLEALLALLYLGVAGSGVAGLLASRTLPMRLTTRGPPVLFARIPALREELRQEIEALVLESAAETSSEVVDRIYRDRLEPFFRGPRNLWRHLVESDRPLQKLLDEISALHRYASEREREILEAIADRVRGKNELDYQYSLQAVLQGWPFVHVPLTYSLLLVAGVHAVLAHAGAGAP